LERLFAGRVSRMHASEIRELLKLLERPDVVSFAGGIPDPRCSHGCDPRGVRRILGDPQLDRQRCSTR